MTEEDNWVPTPKFFKRKKNVVEAVQVTRDNIQTVSSWCGGIPVGSPRAYKFRAVFHPNSVLLVPTLDGPIDAHAGEWVVRDEEGRYDVFTAKQFKNKYEFLGVIDESRI